MSPAARFAVTTFALITTSGGLRAGGSVAYSDLRALLPGEVRTHLEDSFHLPEAGDATRLGKHFTHLGGSRIAPYHFAVTSKPAKGAAFQLTIHMAVEFLDAGGRPVAEPESAVRVRETFESYEVRRSDPGVSAPPPPLSAARQEQVVEEVRRVYGEVEKLAAPGRKREFESGDGMSGAIAATRDHTGTVRKVTLDVATGDHGGFQAEIYYDRQQLPAFILWTDSYWRFDPANQGRTIDHFKEHRLYYSPDGALARALKKEYSGSSEAQLRSNRDRAKNEAFQARASGVFEFRKNAANLALPGNLSNPVKITEALFDAWRLLTGEE